MRPWMIVLSSAVAAIVVIAAIAVPELMNAPRSEIAPLLRAHSPVLAIAGLAVYALCAILLTTASLVSGTLRFRNHLLRAVDDEGTGAGQWGAVFSNQFRPLATRLTYSGTNDDEGAFEARLNGNEGRREMARLYYISLARSHYPSALIVLAGIVALGTAQDHGSLPLQPATIPTASAALIMVGLGLLYVLGRIAVDVTVEPLLETISQLRIPERSEIGLLRRAVELLEMPRNTPRNDSQPAVPVGELPERLIETIEQGQRGLADAISRLSANAETLEAAIRALVEPLATAIHAAAAPKLPADHDKTAGAAFPELQAAVEELTAVLRRLSAPPARAAEPDGASDPAPPSTRPSTPGLARELRRLLQEIEAVR